MCQDMRSSRPFRGIDAATSRFVFDINLDTPSSQQDYATELANYFKSLERQLPKYALWIETYVDLPLLRWCRGTYVESVNHGKVHQAKTF